MSERGPWSVKGIDSRARAVARDAARIEGITLGEYLNNLILEETRDDFPNEMPGTRSGPATSALDQLTRRVEAVEARSTLAITGIDQSVMGLVARLERTENGQQVIAGHVDGFIDDLRETHEALSEKVRLLEQDESSERNVEALRSLEQALGKLATHVYQEGERQQEDDDAIRGRVESGFMDLNDRMEGVETRVESTLSEAARRVEKAVEDAELRSEGATRQLSDRFGVLENRLSEGLGFVDQADARLGKVEDDVSGALGSMEQTLLRIQDRLNRAESTTDAALKSLEGTFDSLDQRITQVAESAGPEAAARLRGELESRFEGLADELKSEIATARAQMAEQIAEATEAVGADKVIALQDGVDRVQAQLAESDARNAEAFDTVGDQVSRITSSFDKRLREVEAKDAEQFGTQMRGEFQAISERVDERLNEIDQREASVIESVGTEVGRLADRLETRMTASESASARAIEQIGDQVSSVAQRLQGRQDEQFGRLSAHVEEARTAQEDRLSGAIANMTERFEKFHSDTTSQISPVQRAIASLAARLDGLDTHAEALGADASRASEDELLAAFSASINEQDSEPFQQVVGGEEFQPGLDDWDVNSDSDENYSPAERDVATAPILPDILAQSPGENPLEALSNWAAEQKAGDDEPIGRKLAFGDVDEPAPDTRDTVVPTQQPERLDLNATDPLGEIEADAETDIAGDDEEFVAFAEERTEYAPQAIEPEPAGVTHTENGLEEDLDASDYISRARRAALAASAGDERRVSDLSGGVGRRVPVYAAASVIVLAAAGAGGYLVLRGKQAPIDPPAQTVITAEQAVAAPIVELAADPVLPIETAIEPAAPLQIVAEPQVTAEPVAAPIVEVAETISAEVTPAAPEVTAPAIAAPVVEAPQPVSFQPIPAAQTLASAARGGDRVAQYQYGVERLNASDYAAGAEMIAASAAQGLPVAQYRLSKLHENGLGVPRDLAAARTWTDRAARGNNVRAMHDLAVFFADGEGGPQSYASAAEWFRKAAEFGVLDSQYNLGVLYDQGLGITADPGEALFWFAVAANNGDTGAANRVAELSNQLPSETVAAITARVAAWVPSPSVRVANGEFGPQDWQAGGAERVRAVQVALNALGYSVGSPDGIIGPATQSAIRTYQQREGLSVTGTISDAFVTSLNGRAGTARS